MEQQQGKHLNHPFYSKLQSWTLISRHMRNVTEKCFSANVPKVLILGLVVPTGTMNDFFRIRTGYQLPIGTLTCFKPMIFFFIFCFKLWDVILSNHYRLIIDADVIIRHHSLKYFLYPICFCYSYFNFEK